MGIPSGFDLKYTGRSKTGLWLLVSTQQTMTDDDDDVSVSLVT